jgi:hypothetical protein
MNTVYTSPTTQSLYDAKTCAVAKLNNTLMPSVWGFTDSSSVATNTLSAVLINGVVLQSYYPLNWTSGNGTADLTDACLGFGDANGTYHYHMMTPCLLNTSINYTYRTCA